MANPYFSEMESLTEEMLRKTYNQYLTYDEYSRYTAEREKWRSQLRAYLEERRKKIEKSKERKAREYLKSLEVEEKKMEIKEYEPKFSDLKKIEKELEKYEHQTND